MTRRTFALIENLATLAATVTLCGVLAHYDKGWAWGLLLLLNLNGTPGPDRRERLWSTTTTSWSPAHERCPDRAPRGGGR